MMNLLSVSVVCSSCTVRQQVSKNKADFSVQGETDPVRRLRIATAGDEADGERSDYNVIIESCKIMTRLFAFSGISLKARKMRFIVSRQAGNPNCRFNPKKMFTPAG